MTPKIIFVDFDGTICPNKNREEFPEPTQECLNVLKKLRENGYLIVIYSVRSSVHTAKPQGHQKMLEYLEKYKIPYDYVDDSKPHFNLVIDDKALGCPRDASKNVSWDEVEKLLEDRNYLPKGV